MNAAEISHRFKYHAPDEAKKNRHADVREALLEVAHDLNDLLPEGREKSLAITHLEEAMFWANAAIAREVVAVSPGQDS